MKSNWNVQINDQGDLVIRAEETMGAFENLFGMKRMEAGLRIYAHELRAVRQLLVRLFPTATIKTLEAIESIIKEEFCDSRSINDFKNCLETAHIPYRIYNNVA